MKKKYFYILVTSLVFITSPFFAQNDSLEVFIIDAFVTPEKPHNLNLSFFTSEEAKTKIEIDNKYLIIGLLMFLAPIANSFSLIHSVIERRSDGNYVHFLYLYIDFIK